MLTAISPSMMCADITAIKETLSEFKKSGIEYLHIDIMDGSFVPNFALGTDYCRDMKRLTDIPLDIHFMVEKPEEKLQWFDFGNGDMVSVHIESTENIRKALEYIRSRGAKAFVAVSPETPVSEIRELAGEIDGVLVMTVKPGFAGQKMIPSALPKIGEVKALFGESMPVEVDGNVSFENAVKMREAGADIFVAGSSSVFKKGISPAEGIAELRRCIK